MHASISLASGLYVIGGWNGLDYINSVEQYDEGYDKFRVVYQMKYGRGMFGIAACNHNNDVVVLGGMNEEGIVGHVEVMSIGKR